MTPTKLQQLIHAIVSRTGRIARLRLAKLVYLVDWEHYRQTGQPLSDAYYLREQKGPLPASLARDLSRMQAYEIETSPGRLDAMEGPGKRPRFQPSFSSEELVTIERILGKYTKYTERDLLLAAYATEPMKALLREESAGGARRHEPVYLKKYPRTVSQVASQARSLQDLSTRYAAFAKQHPALADEDLSEEDIRLILEAYAQSLPLMKTAEEVLAQCTPEGGHDPEIQ